MTAHDDQAGFTLIEMMVGLVIATAVLLAALKTFDVFNKTSVAASQTTQTEDGARRQLDTLTGLLRNSSATNPIVSPSTAGSTNDLVWTTVDQRSGALTTVRYCVAPSLHQLWEETTPGVASAAPSNTCGTAGTWSRVKILDSVYNTSKAPLFTIGTSRQDVDINLLIAGGNGNTGGLSLRSSALIRLPGTPTTPTSTTTTPTVTTPALFIGVQVDASCDAAGTKAVRVLNLAGDFTFSTKANNQTVVLGVGQSVRVKPTQTVYTNVPGYASVNVTAC